MGRRRPQSDREAVFEQLTAGVTHTRASELTGVPVHTIRTWIQRGGGVPRATCVRCGRSPHPFEALPPPVYAYLLGSYLGDGHIYRNAGTYLLRITLDMAYPGIISEIATAAAAVRGRPVRVMADPAGKRCVSVRSAWVSWPCLLPQHGPGRKHHRPIVLEPWQQELVGVAPGMFLRGLIHTDGWRGLNRVTVKGRDYAYPRYQFSNRSEDIRRLFTDTCDKLGIEWRSWGPWHISVARRDAVARLDEFVGPKT